MGRPLASLGVALEAYVAHVSMLGGAGVAGVWVGLALGVGWAPAADWADRLGRWLGAYWIVFGLAHSASYYLNLP